MFSVVILLGCMSPGSAALAAEQNRFRTITVEQLAGLLEDEDVTLVNVHVPYEGEIEQTDALIPFDEISANLDLLPTDKDAEIVLYCRSGRMSEIAAAELAALGYTNVSHVEGGFNAWASSGANFSFWMAPNDPIYAPGLGVAHHDDGWFHGGPGRDRPGAFDGPRL